jgi:hypothetical protein
MCAGQAQTARDEETRTFFNRLRDSWVKVANNYQIAKSLAADAAPSHAGIPANGGLVQTQPER